MATVRIRMLHRFTIVLIAFFIHALALSSYAWSDAGHKTVALLAWAKLSPQARAAVISLLEQHPEFENHFAAPLKAELGDHPNVNDRQSWLFAQAAIWPDFVRPPMDGSPNPNEKYHRASWHYLDLPVFADAESEAQLASTLPKLYWNWKPGLADFIEQRLTAAQVIDKASQLLPDAKQASTERAVLLCWLFHVTGDLHQPCHCSALFSAKQFPKGDRGGNSVLLPEPETNIHSFWDQLLGTKASFAEAKTIAAGIWKEPNLMKATEASASVLDAQVWITEGCELAKSKVYPPEVVASVLKLTPHTYTKGGFSYEAVGPIEISTTQMQTYRANATAAARQQVMTAALRLAKLLETIPAN